MKTYNMLFAPNIKDACVVIEKLKKYFEIECRTLTIPQIAKELNETEESIAHALRGLTTHHIPPICILSDDWEKYFYTVIQAKQKLPTFNDRTKFYSAMMR